nr:ATP-binding cassette domain-containing protein [Williamsia sp. CHRR-6]
MSVADGGVAVSVRGLVKTYGGGWFRSKDTVHALSGVDLEVKAGTVHALLGPNGAGKTTTVRIISTLLRPDAGTVSVLGHDALHDPVGIRRAIGVSGQYAAVDANLTALENLRMVGQLYGLNWFAATERAKELLADFRLTDVADRPTRTFSGGMRRRIDLAGALVARPGLVILDEPTTGLDPRGRRDMWALIEDLVADGTTVLLTTQYLEEADTLADEITVIDKGTVVAQGTAQQLKTRISPTRLTVAIAGDVDSHAVAAALRPVGNGSDVVSERSGEWTIGVDDGSRSAATAVTALVHAGFTVTDVRVTTPTLDDVFLALTETAHGSVDHAQVDEPLGPLPGDPTYDQWVRDQARAAAPAGDGEAVR